MSYACYCCRSFPFKKRPINKDWKFISNIKEFPLFTFNFHLFRCKIYSYVYHWNRKEWHPNEAALALFFFCSLLLSNCSFFFVEHPANSKTLYGCLCVPLIPTYSRLIALVFCNSHRNCKMLILK